MAPSPPPPITAAATPSEGAGSGCCGRSGSGSGSGPGEDRSLRRARDRPSLILTETAFHDAAVAATDAHDDSAHDVDPDRALEDDERMVKIAATFLGSACPEFLTALKGGEGDDDGDGEKEYAKSARDRLIKVGRNVSTTMRMVRRRSSLLLSSSAESLDELGAGGANGNNGGIGGGKIMPKEEIDAAMSLLALECETLTGILTGEETRKVPKVRFGKTELQMPVVTLGCMRFQQAWNRPGDKVQIKSMDQVADDCQENLVEILRYAISNGVTHIETAKGYGSSELQLGFALKRVFEEGLCDRSDLIIQTKSGVTAGMTVDGFRDQILKQLADLQLDYVDLFSVHGLNSDEMLTWLFDHPNGPDHNLIDAVRSLKAEGKIRHVGFSTHGCASMIQRAIKTDAFEYVNLHHHFVGSYTASGDSCPANEEGSCANCDGAGPLEGNLSNVRLAKDKDMGVFVISPYDKGGRVYTPSNKLRELTLPDMEPMTYGSLWIWQHHLHDSKGAPLHTMTVGAARPSDLDQPIAASFLLSDDERAEETSRRREAVSGRLERAVVDAVGENFALSWHWGLPNGERSKYGTQWGNIVWMHNVIKAYGLLEFAKERYNPIKGSAKVWDVKKSREENKKGIGWWGWCPGTAYDPKLAEEGEGGWYEEDLKDCPKENREKIMEAARFVHEWCGGGGGEKDRKEKKQVPLDWQTSYDMRPWTAFPERG